MLHTIHQDFFVETIKDFIYFNIMKKLILLTVIFACFQTESEAANNGSYKNTTISETSSVVKTMVKRRRKKGFLWGLFKKNDCGCPKH